ncbi:hypothetical protein SGGMMB4_05576 [Sodalis glossinidius str. 'morsitans']|uniref:Uncharacterized protein n=1 Tax=Sodalis glossinidius (strain morsitans) TaxID=343509 RepID=A0A193QNH6_SODGM|nr:hypothetical protein [Sodalis glossinidius]CRL46721.1 hypothetical protein SGGMMB4_05576 [Sodalis glossinidius str. 'morsitans']
MVEINKPVIEKLLKVQIEDVLIDEMPEDKYISVMKFYKRDEINRKRSSSPWLVDFIDAPKSKQIH